MCVCVCVLYLYTHRIYVQVSGVYVQFRRAFILDELYT